MIVIKKNALHVAGALVVGNRCLVTYYIPYGTA